MRLCKSCLLLYLHLVFLPSCEFYFESHYLAFPLSFQNTIFNMQTPTSTALSLEMAELEKEWLVSPQRKFLKALLHKHILSQPQLQITSAACLGLGSLSIQTSLPLHFPRRLNKRLSEDSLGPTKDEYYYSSSSEIEGEAEVFGVEGNRSNNEKQGMSLCDGVPRNAGLYHLLLFETVMTCLCKD